MIRKRGFLDSHQKRRPLPLHRTVVWRNHGSGFLHGYAEEKICTVPGWRQSKRLCLPLPALLTKYKTALEVSSQGQSFYLFLNRMNKQSAPKLRLEPGGFRRHQKSCICYFKELLNGCGIHGKCHLTVALRPSFQLR